MTRAQILLEPWQYQFLGALAQKQHKSISQLVREWIEEKAKQQLAPKNKNPLWDMVGIVRDAPSDMAERHDDYLYGSRTNKRSGRK